MNFFKDHGKETFLPKGECVFRQGANDDNLYLVQQGLLKVFYSTRSGKEFVKSFIDSGGYIASISAILGKEKCLFNIIALEDTRLIVVPSKVLLKPNNISLTELSAINLVLLELVQKKERREFEFLCLSAEERYNAFLAQYPGLEKRVSQYDIARYLGKL